MPAPAIVGAVVAAGMAATATTTIGMVFGIAAAIGGVATAVGQITGVKELTIAGTVLGAVGAVGGLAASAGLFGTEAAGLVGDLGGGVTNAAGGGAAEVAQGAVTAGPAPAGGYTWSAVQAADPSLANIPSDVISQAGGGTSDIVDMLAGSVNQVSLAEAPVIADKAVVDVQTPAAINEVANAENLVPNPASEALNPEGLIPDPAKGLAGEGLTPDPTKGLIDQTSVLTADGSPAMGQNVDAALPRDQYGNIIAQGDTGPSGSPAGPNGENALPYDAGPPRPSDPTGGVDGTVSNQPDAGANVNGRVTTTDASTTPGTVKSPVTGQVTTGATTSPAATPAATPPTAAGQLKTPTLDEMLAWKGDPGNIQRADNSIWGNIWKFAKDNPAIALGGVMAASSFLSGAMSPLTPAQTKELDARAEQNLAAANLANTQNELLQRRLNNMRQGIPQVRWKNEGNGLINMPVTGVPA